MGKFLATLPLGSRLDWLRKLNLAIAVASCVAFFALGGIAFAGSVQARHAEGQRKGVADRLKKANAALALALKAPPQTKFEGSDAVESFQEAVNDAADKHSCNVNDLHASSDSSLFVSRYSKTTDEKEWNQTEVGVSLEGKLSDIIATIAEVTAAKVPIELDTLTLDRVGVDGKGDATVNARIELRVLTPVKDGQP